MICNICPRKCNIDRSSAHGFCGESETLRVARIAPHHFEEPPISGTRGSGTVFFSGCSLKCVFCQNKVISREGGLGKQLSADELYERIL
jgi:putative pyruvate formate lyase activating enzyme